jgi:hypothetical protein
LCVLRKGYEGYDEFGKERGQLSRRGVGEMEGGDTDGTWLSMCLTMLKYSSVQVGRHQYCMCHAMCHRG